MAILDPTVQDHLEHLGIQHDVLECDPAFADTAAFCEKYGFASEEAANTILVAGKAEPVRYAACIVLATTKLDVNKAVCRELGVRRASFASAEATTQLTGMMIGGVTTFGLPEDLSIYLDSRVMQAPRVVMGGGNRSTKLLLAPAELLKLPGARVVDGLAIAR